MEIPDIKKLIPQNLDISFRGNDYVIYNGDAPLTTVEGKEITHTNSRLLQHLIFELSLINGNNNKSLNSYKLFSYLKDRLENNIDYVESNFHVLLEDDYFFNLKIKNQNGVYSENIDLLELFDLNEKIVNVVFGGIGSIQNKLNKFLKDNGLETTIVSGSCGEKFINFLKKTYSELSTSYKAAVNILTECHNAGIILPLLLVSSGISPSEYAVSLFTLSLFSKRNNPNDLQQEASRYQTGALDIKSPEDFISNAYTDVLKVIEFLSYFNIHEDTSANILDLIKNGESFNLEFKSTLRWNIKADKKEPAIEHASLKTINAFLNSGGGNLLIGVRDDGSIEGIETDQFLNDDKFYLHFWNLIKESFGNDITPFVKCTLEKIDNKAICNVQCLKSQVPVFLNQKGFEEEFYIRVGPSSVKLGVSETYKYISEHFRKT